MSKKRISDIFIEQNDLNGAYEKYIHTTNRWRSYWFETCLTIFNRSKKWLKEYVIDPVERTIRKVTEPIKQKLQPKPTLYIMELRNSLGKLVYSKIGTTEREIYHRIKEIKTYYKKEDITDIKVVRTYDCGNTPPERYESCFRRALTQKYPDTYKKNDRFIGVKLDLRYCDKLYNVMRKGNLFVLE